VNTLTHELPVVVLPTRFTVAPLQSSDADGGVNCGVAVQSIVLFAGTVPIDGACVSVAVIVCVLVALWLPQASVASHERVYTFTHELPVVVLPTRFTVAPLQSSDADGGVNDGVAVQSIVLFAGTVPIDGACVSVAVIVCVTVALWLPQASVASHERVYTFTHELPVVVLPTRFTVAPLQSSDADGGVNDGVAVQSIVLFAGTVPIDGACVSVAVIVCVTVAL
jgi:hypothetical protein